MLISALVVLELYSIILRGLAGIAKRIAALYQGNPGVGHLPVSLLPLGLEKTPNTLTGYLFMFQRPIMSSLVHSYSIDQRAFWFTIRCLSGGTYSFT